MNCFVCGGTEGEQIPTPDGVIVVPKLSAQGRFSATEEVFCAA
jgi:hypothetical protein